MTGVDTFRNGPAKQEPVFMPPLPPPVGGAVGRGGGLYLALKERRRQDGLAGFPVFTAISSLFV